MWFEGKNHNTHIYIYQNYFHNAEAVSRAYTLSTFQGQVSSLWNHNVYKSAELYFPIPCLGFCIALTKSQQKLKTTA